MTTDATPDDVYELGPADACLIEGCNCVAVHFESTPKPADTGYPSTAQRLIAKIDRDQYPAGGIDSRANVIVRQIIPLEKALRDVTLTADDISFLGWLVEFGEGARVAALVTKIRKDQR